MSEILVRPNAKTQYENIEISCYGEDMIMVDHPILPAPKPIGPRNDKFWEKTDKERLEAILDYLDANINWEKSDIDILVHLGGDINRVREKL